MEGKLWDTQEAVSQTHLFGFGEAFNYTFMFPWLLSWMRKGWLNISMLQKKTYYNEKSFGAFFSSVYL